VVVYQRHERDALPLAKIYRKVAYCAVTVDCNFLPGFGFYGFHDFVGFKFFSKFSEQAGQMPCVSVTQMKFSDINLGTKHHAQTLTGWPVCLNSLISRASDSGLEVRVIMTFTV
jgi:hypothetical protein